MNKLVFIQGDLKSEPFTTSDVVAEYTGNSYRSIQRTIEKHLHRLETLGVMRFEITLPLKGSKGGRPKKVYQLNEPQATLLITFLKNTDIVADFKTELVRQFYIMRAELMKRRIYREQLKPIRREMTDVIQEVDESKWAYKKYTDLSYKVSLGKNASQIRKDRGADKKAKAIDYLTSEEISMVSKSQNQISVLLELGMDYEQVKMMLLNRQLVGNIA